MVVLDDRLAFYELGCTCPCLRCSATPNDSFYFAQALVHPHAPTRGSVSYCTHPPVKVLSRLRFTSVPGSMRRFLDGKKVHYHDLGGRNNRLRKTSSIRERRHRNGHPHSKMLMPLYHEAGVFKWLEMQETDQLASEDKKDQPLWKKCLPAADAGLACTVSCSPICCPPTPTIHGRQLVRRWKHQSTPKSQIIQFAVPGLSIPCVLRHVACEFSDRVRLSFPIPDDGGRDLGTEGL